jgi:hypothetical protein
VIRAAWLLAVGACSVDDGGPRLAQVTPDAAAANAVVAITGTRLCGGGDCTQIGAVIALGVNPPMVDAEIVSYTDTSASFIVPPIVAAGDTSIIVTVGDQSSNALDFEVLPP